MWAAIESIAPKNGCIPQTMHEWARKQEIDIGTRDGITSEQGNRIKALEREVNHHRLLKPIGYIPPAEAEENYYRQLACQTATTEGLKPTGLHETRGVSPIRMLFQ